MLLDKLSLNALITLKNKLTKKKVLNVLEIIAVPEPPKSYRIAIGYTTECGKFHLVAKSNCVTTPAPNTDSFDHNWIDIADDFKKFYALSGGYSQTTTNELQEVFEDKLHRPMNQPEFVRLGNGINNQFQSFDCFARCWCWKLS